MESLLPLPDDPATVSLHGVSRVPKERITKVLMHS